MEFLSKRNENTIRDMEYLKRFFTRPDTGEQHRTVVENDIVDRRFLDSALNEVASFKAMEASLGSQFDQGSPLVADMHYALNKQVPMLRDESEVDPRCVLNREVIREMMDLHEMKTLRDYTCGDPVAAALAATTMESKVVEMMTDLQEQQDAVDSILSSEEELSEEELEGLLDGFGEGLSNLRSQVKDAVSEANDLMEAMAGMSRAWGTDPGEFSRVPAADRIALAQRIRNNRALQLLANLLGAFENFAFAMQHQKTDQIQTDIFDIHYGSDLSHVLPSEFGLLADDATELEFYRRYEERSLMQYALRGREKVAKGGIVVCVDTSGSMRGERDAWAKAISLACLRIAQKQDRSFHGILFGSANELAGYDLSNAGMSEILDFAAGGYWGGTDFEAPLNMAMQFLQAEHDREGSLKSDILFITDDCCGVSENFMAKLTKFKEDLGCRIFGITIGVDGGYGPLREISDGRMFPVSLLNSPEEVADIFRAL